MKKMLVILGPTATGKTDLALFLAKKFNGEIVSFDSRQVYIGLDIGTGKAPGSGTLEVRREKKRWEVGGVKIWMYDVVSPKRQYSVADYIRDANEVILDIRKSGKLPIIVGGTGLYLKGLLNGLSNLSIPIDQKLRKKLVKLSTIQLQEKLKKISPKKWENMNYADQQNPRRLVRAIELTTHLPILLKIATLTSFARNDVLRIGLTASREVLYKLVDERVVKRIDQGMIEEAKNLHKHGLSLKRMGQLGLEYGVLADYLSGEIQGNQGLIKIMQGKIHGYIRHQLTWFKKERNIFWFDVSKKNLMPKVEKLVRQWYYQAHATKD